MRRTVVLVPLLLLLSMAGVAKAAPEADPWPRWDAHDADSTATIDHSAWTRFLQKYVEVHDDGANRVDYGAVTPEDRRHLGEYIERLSTITISDYSRPVQRAYWINLYNALTVDLILKHYPVDSIRDIDISPGWFSDGPWGAKLVRVEGVKLSLNDIEHRILRPLWQDPRIHYAVNCASIGCPDLQPTAWTGADVDERLDAAARSYINDPRGATIRDGELIVSSIYEWFQADFGGSEAGVLRHLRRYADEPKAAALEGFSGYDDDRYDWSLNDVKE